MMMTMNNNNGGGDDDHGNEKPVKQSRFRLAVNGIVGRLFLAPIVLLALGANTLIGKGRPDWVAELDQYAEGIRGGFVTICWMILFIMAMTTGFVVLVLGSVVGVKAAAVIGWLAFPVGSTALDLAKLAKLEDGR